MRTALALLALALTSTQASAQVFASIDFQNTIGSPATYSVVHDGGSTNLSQHTVTKGTCNASDPLIMWNSSHETSGGWNGRNFVRITFCPDVQGANPAGYYTGLGTIEPTAQYSDVEYFARFRLRVTGTYQTTHPTWTSTNAKFFLFPNSFSGTGADGSQRMIASFYSASNWSGNNATHIGWDIAAGVTAHFIGIGTPLFQVGEWIHVQQSWKWGATNVGWNKLWVNSNTYSSPTWINQDFTAICAPPTPGCTAPVEDEWTWPGRAALIQTEMKLGDREADRSQIDDPVTFDLMDFELGLSYKTDWYPGSGVTPTNKFRGPKGVKAGEADQPANMDVFLCAGAIAAAFVVRWRAADDQRRKRLSVSSPDLPGGLKPSITYAGDESGGNAHAIPADRIGPPRR